MERERVYELANKYTSKDRNTQYGGPEKSFGTTARMWNAYLEARPVDKGTPVDAGDVAAMLGLLKLARIANNKEKGDSWVDLAGYAACGAEVSKASDPEGDKAITEPAVRVGLPPATSWDDDPYRRSTH